MAKPYGIDLPKLFADKLGNSGLFEEAVLTVRKRGTPTSGSRTKGTNPTETTHKCKAQIDDYMEEQKGDTGVQRGVREITILAASLPSTVVPKPNDKITMEDGVTYRIADDGVSTDAMKAVYVCSVKR